MNKNAGGNVALKLPTAEEPLPEFLGTPGLLQLRALIREGFSSNRRPLAPAETEVVRKMVDALRLAMVPAKPAVLGGMLEALMWHYPAVQRSPEAAASIASDWLRDLGHFPPDIVDAACTGWRRGQNSYAPSPGHLLAIGDPIVTARRHLLTMAERLILPAGSVKAAAGGRS